MKKQIKQSQKQNEAEAKQNSTPSGNTNQVSEDTKSKLVKQYRDRADASSTEWDSYDLPKNSIDSDDGFPEEKNVYRPNSSIHGEGLNGGPGDITQQQVATPWNLGDDVVNNNMNRIGMDNLQNIVHAMSEDYQRELDASNGVNPLGSMGDITPADLASFQDVVARDFYRDPDASADGKSIYDYFNDEGVSGWLTNNPNLQTAQQKEDFARLMQVLAMYENLYPQETPDSSYAQTSYQEPIDRPVPRRRNITGSAIW